jgi:hypothetical protein
MWNLFILVGFLIGRTVEGKKQRERQGMQLLQLSAAGVACLLSFSAGGVSALEEQSQQQFTPRVKSEEVAYGGFSLVELGSGSGSGIVQSFIERPDNATSSWYTGVSHFRHVNNPNLFTFVFSAGRHDGGTNTQTTVDLSKPGNPFSHASETFVGDEEEGSTFTWASTFTKSSGRNVKHYALFSGGSSAGGFIGPSKLYSWKETADGTLQPEVLEWVESPEVQPNSARFGQLVDLGDVVNADGARVSSSGSFDIVITGTGGVDIYSSSYDGRRSHLISAPSRNYVAAEVHSSPHTKARLESDGDERRHERDSCGIACSGNLDCMGGCNFCNGFTCYNPDVEHSIHPRPTSVVNDDFCGDPDDWKEGSVYVMPAVLPPDRGWRRIRHVSIPEGANYTTYAFLGVSHLPDPADPEHSYLVVAGRSSWDEAGDVLNAPCLLYDYHGDRIVQEFAAEGRELLSRPVVLFAFFLFCLPAFHSHRSYQPIP